MRWGWTFAVLLGLAAGAHAATFDDVLDSCEHRQRV